MALITLAIAAATIAATPAPSPRPGAPAARVAPKGPQRGPEGPEPAQAGTTLSAAYYDQRYKVVVVPYSGPVPTYTQGTVGNPPRVFLDFQARFTGGFPSGTAEGHPNLTRWAMARRGDTTRLTLTFKEATKVRVLHNAKRKLLVLVPQPVDGASPSPAPAASPSPSPTPAAGRSPAAALPGTTLGAPRYDAARGALVIPYQGPVPAHISEPLTSPPRVYFDFEAAYRLRNMPGGLVSGHPTFTRWVLNARDRDTTRVTLTFSQPTRVQLQIDEARRELWLVPQAPEASPAPAATPTPRRSVAPTVAPSPTPAPTASPEGPAPAATLEPPRLTPSEKPTPLNSP